MVRAALFSATVLAGSAIAMPNVPRQDVTQAINFDSFSFNGEGCPPGSVMPGKIDFAAGEFELLYGDFDVSIAPNGPKQNVKCQLEVVFSTTAQRQIVVMGGSYRGHINITEGVYAKQQNQYKFKGNPGVSNMQWEFKGPIDSDTVFENVLNATLISPCQQAGAKFTMTINNYLTLTSNDGGSGTMRVSNLDSKLHQSIAIKEQQC